MNKKQNISGNRYGRLVAIKAIGQTANRGSIWSCACDCGASPNISISSLKSGHTQSCGCLGAERRRIATTKHGASGSQEYAIWASMIKRCNLVGGPYYNKRIVVCGRWRNSFAAFVSDMGPRPSINHSIDRINNYGDYSPDNCRWADARTQANNTNRNVWISFNGARKTVAEWARSLRVPYTTIMNRYYRGWSAQQCLKQPQALRQA